MDEEWVMKHTAPGRFVQERELIRCKECKMKFEDNGELWCTWWGRSGRYVKADDFCSHGERRYDE